MAERGTALAKQNFSNAVPKTILPATCVAGSTNVCKVRRMQHTGVVPQQNRLQSTEGEPRKLDRVYKKHDHFPDRHIGPNESDITKMLSVIGAEVCIF